MKIDKIRVITTTSGKDNSQCLSFSVIGWLTCLCNASRKKAGSTFLDAFPKLWKANTSFLMSVCLSVHMEQLGSYWTDFREIWHLRIFFFEKSVEKIQFLLKSDKNKGYLAWRPIYRGADKSLARPTSPCILFDGENISFDASLVINTVIPRLTSDPANEFFG